MPTAATQIIAVTDLGEKNKGSIGAGDLTPEERQAVITDVAKPEYRKRATNRFRCVDGRLPEDGIDVAEDEADPQIAGSEAVSGTAADFMVGLVEKLSTLVAKNTRETIAAGYEVIVHGDDHKGKAGCGANVNLRAVLASNAENVEIVAPTTWTLCELIGIDQYLTQSDIVDGIKMGAAASENDELWDVSPEEVVDVAVANGATYEELAGSHNEKVAKAETDETLAHDEVAFKRDHPIAGGTLEAFGVAFGAYKAMVFDKVRQQGGTEAEAAQRVAMAIAFNVGVCKQLWAKEEDPEAIAAGMPGSALSVVIVGSESA